MPLNEQQLILKVEELKKTYAVEALSKPVAKDSFEYGRHCGVIEGIAKTQQLLHELLHGDDEKHERKRTINRTPYTA